MTLNNIVTVNIDLMSSVRPTDEEMGLIVKLPFISPEMINVEWINWAIDYTQANLFKPERVRYSLVLTYKYYSCLQEACKKYLMEEEYERNKTI